MRKIRSLFLICLICMLLLTACSKAKKDEYHLILEEDQTDKNMNTETVETYEEEDLRPWESENKKPEDYTWEEFEALSAGQQTVFQKSFEDEEGFAEWLQKMEPEATEASDELILPWENGGKPTKDYTWEEFEALDAGQQMAFQKDFGSLEAFDEWLYSAMPEEKPSEENPDVETEVPWEEDGKQPEDYTWGEFEDLNAEQQDKFQQSFESSDKFDEWMSAAQNDAASDALYLPWENGGKQPDEYTWEEFEALNVGQQDKFQKAFDSMDDFDKWLERVGAP